MSESPPTNQPGRMARAGAGLIVLLIFLTPLVGFIWLRTMSQAAAEQSALWHTRDMIIVHFARSRGAWPQSWEDLEDDFKPADAGYQNPDIEAVQKLVEVDFDFDVVELEQDVKPKQPLRVLWLKDRDDTDAVIQANAGLIAALGHRLKTR